MQSFIILAILVSKLAGVIFVGGGEMTLLVLKGNFRSKKLSSNERAWKMKKNTSHHRPQCAQWFLRYSISKSGIWAIWTSPFCRFLASFSLKYDVTDAMLQGIGKTQVQYLMSLLFDLFGILQAVRSEKNKFCLTWNFVAMATQTRIISRFSKTKDYCFLTIRIVYHPFFFKRWYYLQQQSNCIVSNYFLNITFA